MSEGNGDKIRRKQDGTFAKGQTGNPKGRPVGSGLSCREELRRAAESSPDKIAAVVRAVVDKAAGGDLRYIEFLFQNVDGKLTDFIQQESRVTVDRAPVDVADPDAVAEDREALARLVSRGSGANGSQGPAGGRNGSGA